MAFNSEVCIKAAAAMNLQSVCSGPLRHFAGKQLGIRGFSGALIKPKNFVNLMTARLSLMLPLTLKRAGNRKSEWLTSQMPMPLK